MITEITYPLARRSGAKIPLDVKHQRDNQFALTYRTVRCKQHSAVFLNQVSSFNPIKKEDLKWFVSVQNPVTLNRKRAGVFVLWP